MRALEIKVPPAVIALATAAAMWGLSQVGTAFELNAVVRNVLIGGLLIAASFFGISGTLAFKRAATTVNPLKPERASSLVVLGVYRMSRNPMYLSMVLVLLAWAVFLSSVWAFVCLPGFVLSMNRFQIVPEERALLKLFGAEFEAYRSKVRRWL